MGRILFLFFWIIVSCGILFIIESVGIEKFSFMKKNKHNKFFGKSGQNAIEYMLLFSGVVVVMLFVTGKNGLLTTSIQDSMDEAMNYIQCMPLSICFEASCPAVAGDGCCEAEKGEVCTGAGGDCPCVCPAQDLGIGGGTTGTFTKAMAGKKVLLVCPSGLTGNPNRECLWDETWGPLQNGCL
ncbi:hypothetical protein MNBD_UNCLBAC01-1012 [hydrothermal vent metagenome]|uniref:Uncharacterized protein n=1 Tax=hydrothermal vent metagenome TaxID=652676 RepID=A0A3B1DW78_9ZZZZ